MRFSERHGFRPVRDALQLEGIDSELRTALWNVLLAHFWEPAEDVTQDVQYHHAMKPFLELCYSELFNWPLTAIPRYVSDARETIDKALQRQEWYWTYDFIEFCIRVYEPLFRTSPNDFTAHLNRVLEREGSGYRVVDGRIAAITDPSEVAAVEEAMGSEVSVLAPVRAHLRTALAMLSDRTEPNYRNSVKESISAVEALVNLLVGEKRTTLGAALKRVDPDGGIHPALIEAFGKIYGYTSDAGGIRHAMLEEDSVGHEDALYMLVSCSAFVNYVVAKAAKAGASLADVG
jgi:hypothetical protein